MTEENREKAVIALSEYNRLLDRDRKLHHLESYGVDNWSGYDEAHREYLNEKEGKE